MKHLLSYEVAQEVHRLAISLSVGIHLLALEYSRIYSTKTEFQLDVISIYTIKCSICVSLSLLKHLKNSRSLRIDKIISLFFSLMFTFSSQLYPEDLSGDPDQK